MNSGTFDSVGLRVTSKVDSPAWQKSKTVFGRLFGVEVKVLVTTEQHQLTVRTRGLWQRICCSLSDTFSQLQSKIFSRPVIKRDDDKYSTPTMLDCARCDSDPRVLRNVVDECYNAIIEQRFWARPKVVQGIVQKIFDRHPLSTNPLAGSPEPLQKRVSLLVSPPSQNPSPPKSPLTGQSPRQLTPRVTSPIKPKPEVPPPASPNQSADEVIEWDIREGDSRASFDKRPSRQGRGRFFDNAFEGFFSRGGTSFNRFFESPPASPEIDQPGAAEYPQRTFAKKLQILRNILAWLPVKRAEVTSDLLEWLKDLTPNDIVAMRGRIVHTPVGLRVRVSDDESSLSQFEMITWENLRSLTRESKRDEKAYKVLADLIKP